MLELAASGTLFDAMVTDPPYDLVSVVKRFGGANAAPAKHGTNGLFARQSRGFMGKEWDGTGVAFSPDTWRLAYDVLKPGAHLLAFGGSRTYHRMAVAIEDAGFEIRDCIMWLYGTGFPKSHNLDGAWDGWGTALKPAFEPIIVARKPLDGTVAANVLAHGTGALNIDASRIAAPEGKTTGGRGRSDGAVGRQPSTGYDAAAGRWPANVIHDGSDEVLEAFAAYGESKSSDRPRHNGAFKSVAKGQETARTSHGHADTGTAARFFYSAKASAADRANSKHPTVKPLALMRYLVTLVTPPGGTVLDPFSGSGTTLQAAAECGFNAVGIERDPEYQADILRRIARLQAAELEALCA